MFYNSVSEGAPLGVKLIFSPFLLAILIVMGHVFANLNRPILDRFLLLLIFIPFLVAFIGITFS